MLAGLDTGRVWGVWIGVSSCKLVYSDPSSNSQLGRFSTLCHSTPVELEC
eukprot:SAG25_NODE_128_length_14556_cov_11.699405_2_plen_50_part_00